MNKNKLGRNLLLIVLCLGVNLLSAQENDTLLTILQEELNREYEVLSKADMPIYYLDYRVDDEQDYNIIASFGSILQSGKDRSRIAQPLLRMGNYQLDQTREISGYYGNQYGGRNMQAIPLDNSEAGIKQFLWMLTDRAYQEAKDKYEKVIEAEAESKKVNDFSNESPNRYYEAEQPYQFNVRKWEAVARKLSSVFINQPDVIVGKVFITYRKNRKYFVSSEGASIVQNNTHMQLHIYTQAVNQDGEAVELYESFNANDERNMPSLDSMLEKANEMLSMIQQLKNAPYAEPYTGPAILHPRAAAVFFHEIFGHRIEGHRLKSNTDGQTFKEKVGEKILPSFMNIYADPTLRSFNGEDLNGSYKYDDQGVKTSRITIVEHGKLKNFLMSRAPIKDFSQSNGHGRSSIGISPVARQSNLIVKTNKGLKDSELRKHLINECKKQGKEYGYYFVDVTGGFTQTSRYQTNSFNIMPTIVYKIYVDGRPDELVKGVDLIGTPLSMFAEVISAGETAGVFNGICGAESGNIPVSAVSPSILVRRIETQKKPVNEVKSEKPILTPPVIDENDIK